MKNDRPITTIRAVLETLGLIDRVVISTYPGDLDIPVTVSGCSFGDSYGEEHRGELATYCSGTCLIAFNPQQTPTSVRWRPLYLTYDDSEHRAWNVRYDRTPYEERHTLGPCPRVRLRLVQSA